MKTNKLIGNAYRSYNITKNWSGKEDKALYSVFEQEFKNVDLTNKKNILDIGSGYGEVLRWFTSNNHDVEGIDFNEDLVRALTKEGFDIKCGNILDEVANYKKNFDLIVMFDLLEHIHLEDIDMLFSNLKSILSKDGSIFIRVPNGQSPFGRYYPR